MCDTFNDPRAMNDLRQIVAGFISRGETFTAAHVTMAARSQALLAGTLSHTRGVAPVVRSLYRDGTMTGYSQTQVNDFNVYYPSGTDPRSVNLRIGGSSWIPRVSRSAVTDPANQAPAPVTQAPAPVAPQRATGIRADIPLAKEALRGGVGAVDGLSVRVEYNGEGYAQMPNAMLKACDLSNGAGVVLEGVQLGGTVTLRKALAGETPSATVQQANGALRIRDRLLMPYGVGLNEDVVVCLSGTTLILT